MNSINPEQLALLVHVAECGSISAAARLMNIAPSVATRRLAQLEQALGVRLFERTTRRLRPTEAGRLTLQWAQQSLASQAELIDDLAALQGTPSGLIRMVSTQYAASEVLPAVLARFSLAYPKIRLAMGTSDSLVDLVENHYDVAVHSGMLPDSSLVATRLQTFERVLCATPAYLARRGAPAHPADLAQHDCLVHAQTEPRTWFFRRDDQVVAQPIAPLAEADNYSVLLGLARASMGIVRLGEVMVRDDLAAGRLVRVLPAYHSVFAGGELPGLWVVYPNRRVLHRTRVLIDYLTRELSAG